MLKELLSNTRSMRDFRKNEEYFDQPWLKKYYVEQMDMSSGRIKIHMELDMRYYYEMLSELIGSEVQGEYEFYRMIKDLADQRDEFSKVSQAVAAVKGQGYGMVTPKAGGSYL